MESVFEPNSKFQDPESIKKRELPVLKFDFNIVSRKVLGKPQYSRENKGLLKILNCIVEIFMNEQHMD